MIYTIPVLFKNKTYNILFDSEELFKKALLKEWRLGIQDGFISVIPKRYVVKGIRSKCIGLNKYLYGISNKKVVKFKDGNTLNHMSSNVSITDRYISNQMRCTHRKRSDNLPIGVRKVNLSGKCTYRAGLSINKKTFYLGSFASAFEAAIVYNTCKYRFLTAQQG